MSLLEAVIATGPLTPDSAAQAQKKRYEEYFVLLREVYNNRNPHAVIGEESSSDEEE